MERSSAVKRPIGDPVGDRPTAWRFRIWTSDSKFTQFYQKQLDKLKNANNAQQNNENQSKINSMLEDINTKFDSIKSKLESILNGSSSDGQSN